MGRYIIKTGFLLLVCTLVIPLALFSQQPVHSFFAGFSAGPSFPLGKYYMNNPEEGSYANHGVSLSAQAGWYFKDHWGLSLHVGEHLHPVDEAGRIADKLAADPFLEKLLLKSGPFEIRTFMAGLSYRRSLYKTLYISGKAMGGVMWARTPDQLYGASYFGGINYSYTITPAKDVTPSFLVAVALEHDVCEQIRIALESDFVMGNTEFTFYTTNSSYQEKHQITFLNVMFNVSFLF